jgi:hypothetical protein
MAFIDVPPSVLAAEGQDVAVLKVRGNEFQDWESVYVQLRWHDALGQ